MDEITLRYKVSDDAYSEFSEVIALRHPVFVSARKRSLANKVIPLGMISLGIATASHMTATALIVFVLGSLWCWHSWRKFPTRFSKEQLNVRKKINFDFGTAEKTLKINATNIVSEMPGAAKTEIYWPSVQYWFVGEKMILIGISAKQGIVVPISEISTSDKEKNDDDTRRETRKTCQGRQVIHTTLGGMCV